MDNFSAIPPPTKICLARAVLAAIHEYNIETQSTENTNFASIVTSIASQRLTIDQTIGDKPALVFVVGEKSEWTSSVGDIHEILSSIQKEYDERDDFVSLVQSKSLRDETIEGAVQGRKITVQYLESSQEVSLLLIFLPWIKHLFFLFWNFFGVTLKVFEDYGSQFLSFIHRALNIIQLSYFETENEDAMVYPSQSKEEVLIGLDALFDAPDLVTLTK